MGKILLPRPKSPLNYMGGKHKLLPQLLSIFPNNSINTFVDLFCGGANVGINMGMASRKVVYNDTVEPLINLYKIFYTNSKEKILNTVQNIIDEYGLSKTSVFGYSHYRCESSRGVGKYNKKGFTLLKEKYNNEIRLSGDLYMKSIFLFVLITYAFNNQIRFNKNGEFNLAVGKRDFNNSIKSRLTIFIDRLQSQNCIFTNKNFMDFDFSSLTSDDFVYCDPPYLGSVATYNESNGWTEAEENELLSLLDGLNDKNIRFALSNNLKYKNTLLNTWKDKYNVHYLISNYSNCNYQKKDRNLDTEILITNY